MLERDLKKKIDSCKIVSFDIFDTLVYRPFWNPEDLFLYIEKKYQLKDFYKNRIKAAEVAYSKMQNAEDTTLDNIYDNFAAIINDYDFAKKIKNIEIQEETAVCNRNEQIYSIYKYALKKNKQIIFTSDMYLSEDTIKNILVKNGYEKYDKLYLSSTYAKLKRTGNLFKIVLNDLNIAPNKMLHIGDNQLSDYEMPMSLGIKAHLIIKCQDKYKNSNFLKTNCFNDTTLSNYAFNCAFNYDKHKKKKYWYKFGYEIAGPICLNFVKWIIQKTDNANCKDVIFIARDGFLLEKIYNKLTNNKNRTHYLYAPRSLNLLCQLNYEKGGFFAFEHTKTIIDYYRTKSTKIKSLPEIKSKEDGLKYIDENYDEIKTLADMEYKNFINYINSHLDKAEKTAIVDSVSLFFSAQKIIEKCTNKKLYGLYYLIQEGAVLDGTNNESFSPMTKYKQEYSLIEFIMSSIEPPIISISGGKPVYNAISKEEHNRIKAFKEITKGVLDFTNDYINSEHNIIIDFAAASEAILDLINLFIKKPSLIDKKMFYEVQFAHDPQHSEYKPLFPEWYPAGSNIGKQIDLQDCIKKTILLFKLHI